ncbi:MAG: hypothetical protein A4E53_04606 [Pelotomaculum sp. PtaB.Bin104]|nr:MAG: hypothetical protein A4E53_04606 [Pelotomaculum sp. PtaB.Bin104]
MGHHYYSKMHKYGFFLNLFKQFLNNRSSYGRSKKTLTAGNFLFLGIASFLLIFLVFSAIADIFNGLSLSNWLSMAWNSIMGMPVADMAKGGEKLLNEASKATTPQDIVSSGQQILSSIGVVVLALLDEAIGIGLLFIAFVIRIINQFVRPMATFSWFLLFSSLVPSAIKHL